MTAATVEDLKRVEAILGSMPEAKLKELFARPELAAFAGKKWIPNPGPQKMAYNSLADELFYGGQAGGGKSDLMMGLAIEEHHMSLLLRRTNKEASKFIKRLADIIGTRDGWNGQLATFTLPDGKIIETGGCQLEDDRQKYKGDPHDLIGFDEISDFSETQYRFIIGWNRSTRKGQRKRVVAAGNPPTRPEGMWVVKYWGAWLDPSHPNPAKDGELRWYTNIGGTDMEVDGPGPHVVPGEEKPIFARSRTFIRAELDDNPDLEESGYDSVLASLPSGLRQAYRDGRFDIVLEDDAFQVCPSSWVMAAQARWTPDGNKNLTMTAMGIDPAGGGADPAAMSSRYGGWYSPLVMLEGKDTADGSSMAGLVLRHRKDGCPIIIDVGGGYAGSVITRFQDNNIGFTRFDGAAGTGARSVGSNLEFANKRAMAYWRFREALDPDQDGGSIVELPPDMDMRTELTAVRYKLGPNGILLEPKDDIRKRIGRSPNKADAIVMSWAEGEKQAAKKEHSGGRRPRVVRGYEAVKKRFGR